MKILLPTPDAVEMAAEALRRGELVGMPTETVYGIAADAMSAAAVQRVFAAKGRPADNPLIVHVASFQQVLRVASEVPAQALILIERYWPGPLTLVLPKRPEVPDITTGGLDTVAVRMPAHPVARQLIEVAGIPIAAPSANPFMSLSPTKASDIDEKLLPFLACILDGGECEVGLESTVVDATVTPPVVLRPGKIRREEIAALVGAGQQVEHGTRKSPGMYPRHYAPKVPVRLVKELGDFDAGLRFGESRGVFQIEMPPQPEEYAHQLYGNLHDLERQGVVEICIQTPPRSPEWEAIWDRLHRMVSQPS